jgi:hypothetical protein
VLLPVVWRFVRLAFFLTITCVTSIFVGIPRSVERIADSWIMEATAAGVPLGVHPALRTGARVAASITLILGWLILASLTVLLVRAVF